MSIPTFLWTLIPALWFASSAAFAEENRPPDPLFLSNDILDVRIVAPVQSLQLERPIDEEFPATLGYRNAAGEDVVFDIQIRTRGKFRRDKENCRFPPIRLNFKKSQVKDTLFDKQDKVKLVTHCKNSGSYDEVVLREYVAYRLLNVMTPMSFNVRLLRVTYVDNKRDNSEETKYAFIIEHRDRLAKRTGNPYLEVAAISPKMMQGEYANLVAMFHYLIGNTDFSPVRGAKGEPCCHNHVLFGTRDEPIFSVPYDFDQAGLVNAPHASPNPKLRIRSVRKRLYRGRCENNDMLPATVAKYLANKEDLLQVVRETGLSNAKSVKSMSDYIVKFYRTIESPKSIESDFVKKCI